MSGTKATTRTANADSFSIREAPNSGGADFTFMVSTVERMDNFEIAVRRVVGANSISDLLKRCK